ncbi:zinc finger protein 883-like isoform X2 [Tachysurus fulvidraco]|nr:zinc finger protein 883-like isoform X2 [Tachysurus fulvidraco]
MHHDQLFLAHKSVLAAFSPVFACLLPHHGSFMDLNSPLLTPQTLTFLLDYMYTGTLPPKSHEEPVIYAAFHLQMEQLQHALTCRRKENELTHTGNDQANKTRGFTEHEPLDKTLVSSSTVPCCSDQPRSSTPNNKFVPVICHLKSTGNKNLALQTLCLEQTIDKPSEANKQPQSSEILSESKHDKTENWDHDMPSVGAEKVEQPYKSCKSGQFQSSGSQNITHIHSNTDNKDQCVHRENTGSKHSSPEHDCRKSDNSDSDVEVVQSFNPSESEKHVPGIYEKKSYNTSDDNSETTSQAFSQHMTNSLKREDGLYFENSSSTDTNVISCKGHYYAPTSEEVALGEESLKSNNDCCEFSNLRKHCVNAYHGHLRYHFLPELNNSISDVTCQGPNAELNGSTDVLETIDMAEILLSTRKRLNSVSHHQSNTHRFQCSVPDCEKAFSQRGSLNRHMRSHLGIRPYSCPLCTMTFSRQYRVTEHMRVHQRSCEDPP